MRQDAIDPTLLRAINGSDSYRLLRRLEVKEGEAGRGGRTETSVGLALDVETTGVTDDDVIIELEMRRFRFDADGVIVKIDRMYGWLEDPVRPIAEEIVKLTRITDKMGSGRRIDEHSALRPASASRSPSFRPRPTSPTASSPAASSPTRTARLGIMPMPRASSSRMELTSPTMPPRASWSRFFPVAARR